MSEEQWSDSSGGTYANWPMMSEIEWSDWWHDFIAKPMPTRPSSGSSSKPITQIPTDWLTSRATEFRSLEGSRMALRVGVIVATDYVDADHIKANYPQFRFHVTVTPRSSAPKDFVISEYVWTPLASQLPARTRLALRGKLAPLIDEDSMEEEFPSNLLSW